MKKLKPGKNNQEDRMNFISYWANFVKNNPDQEWGKQQNLLINSQMQNAKHYPFSPKEYLKMKGEKFTYWLE